MTSRTFDPAAPLRHYCAERCEHPDDGGESFGRQHRPRCVVQPEEGWVVRGEKEGMVEAERRHVHVVRWVRQGGCGREGD